LSRDINFEQKLAIKTNATLSELYTAEADFNFDVDTTHRKTFQKKTALSIKSSRWFQFN
jgi:hypothetical protein